MTIRARLAALLAIVFVTSVMPALAATADDAPTPSAPPSVEAAALKVIEFAPGGLTAGVVPGTKSAQLKVVFDRSQVVTPGVTFTYQWKRNGVNVKNSTASTFTLSSADGPKTISVVVTVRKSGYASVPVESPGRKWGAQVSSPSDNVIPIYGTLRFGSSVYVGDAWSWTVIDGGAELTPTKSTYQWYRRATADGPLVKITGATKATYVNTVADIGKYVAVRVTSSGPGIVPGLTALSGTAGPVGYGVISNRGTAVMTMNPSTNTLTASLQGLDPVTPAASFSYLWYRQGSSSNSFIPGATGKTYKLQAADRDALLSVIITVHRPGFNPVQTTDEGSDALYFASSAKTSYTLHFMAPPGFSHTPHVGESLAPSLLNVRDADNAIPSTTPKYTFVWLRNSETSTVGATVITGATAQSYKPTSADVGKHLIVRVSVNYPGYLPVQPTAVFISNVVLKGDFAYQLHAPVVTKSSAAPPVLTAKVPSNAFAVAPTSYTYEWYRVAGGSGGGVAIPGAHSSSYRLTSADYDALIFVTATAHRAGYLDYPITSDSADYSLKMAAPIIGYSGVAASGNTLTAYPQALTPNVTAPTYTYAWYRVDSVAGTAVKVSASKSYKLVNADANKTIVLRVHVAKGGYITAPYVEATPLSIPALPGGLSPLPAG